MPREDGSPRQRVQEQNIALQENVGGSSLPLCGLFRATLQHFGVLGTKSANKVFSCYTRCFCEIDESDSRRLEDMF